MKQLVILLSLSMALWGCSLERAPLGSEKNPIKFFFVPSVDAQVISDQSKILESYLEANTPYKFEIKIPHSYVAVVEAFGTKRADIASMNTFGYIMAHEKYGAQAGLTVERYGHYEYRGQIIAKTDGEVKKLEDIQGKKIAFVDPASTSGYLLPAKLLVDKGIQPGERIFARKHDIVITMLYQNQADVGATFHSPAHDGKILDARRLVKTQFPDVEKEISIISLTDPIPNDPVVFRKDLNPAIREAVTKAMLDFIKTEDGKDAFNKLFSVTGLRQSTDADYDSVRDVLKAVGKTASELVSEK